MPDNQVQSTITVDVEVGEMLMIGETVVVEVLAKSGRHAPETAGASRGKKSSGNLRD